MNDATVDRARTGLVGVLAIAAALAACPQTTHAQQFKVTKVHESTLVSKTKLARHSSN